jgi:hypothetical protein
LDEIGHIDDSIKISENAKKNLFKQVNDAVSNRLEKRTGRKFNVV